MLKKVTNQLRTFYENMDSKCCGHLRLYLIIFISAIVLIVNISVFVKRYFDSLHPQIDDTTNNCIQAVGAAYDMLSLGDFHLTSFIVENDTIYDFGMTDERSFLYLNANYAGLPEMYYSLDEDTLYFKNNGDDQWFYINPTDAEYFISYIKDRENEFLINYLNYAEYSKINTTEVVYRGVECYDLQFFYDEEQIFSHLNNSPSDGIIPSDNLSENESGTEIETNYYEGHYYIRKSDMTVISFVSMIGETYLFQDEKITIPPELSDASPGQIKVNYIDDEDTYNYNTESSDENNESDNIIPSTETIIDFETI